MIAVFRRQRLPACLPLLVAPLQEARQNIETEFLLLLATPKSYLPACVPVQSFFVTLCAVPPPAPGSNVHAVSQAKILEWRAISCGSGSFASRDQAPVPGMSCAAGVFFTAQPP